MMSIGSVVEGNKSIRFSTEKILKCFVLLKEQCLQIWRVSSFLTLIFVDKNSIILLTLIVVAIIKQTLKK